MQDFLLVSDDVCAGFSLVGGRNLGGEVHRGVFTSAREPAEYGEKRLRRYRGFVFLHGCIRALLDDRTRKD